MEEVNTTKQTNSDYKHNLFFIDYETTGFNPYHNDVIEVAIKLFGSGSYYQTLIKPTIDPKKPRAGGIHRLVPEKVIDVTGITDKMLIDGGIKTNTSTMKTLKYIFKHATKDKQPIYLTAHNGSVFDFIFLKRLMKEANIAEKNLRRSKRLMSQSQEDIMEQEMKEKMNMSLYGDLFGKDGREEITKENQINTLYEMTKRFRFIDTCLLARMYMRDERVNQPRLCQKYNIVNDAEHRALGDILALEKLYPIMCSKVSNVLGKDESWLLNNPQKVVENLMIG
jgi:DNA polymerase III epsilon subunit-like protein